MINELTSILKSVRHVSIYLTCNSSTVFHECTRVRVPDIIFVFTQEKEVIISSKHFLVYTMDLYYLDFLKCKHKVVLPFVMVLVFLELKLRKLVTTIMNLFLRLNRQL